MRQNAYVPTTDPIEIHLISDSTGDTAARVARAAQTQFSSHPTTLVRHPRVTTVDGLSRAFSRITRGGGVAVFFTLIDRELRGRDLHAAVCARLRRRRREHRQRLRVRLHADLDD